MWSKIGITVGVSVLLVVIYFKGFFDGSSKVQLEYNEYKLEAFKKATEQKIKYDALSKEHSNLEASYIANLKDIKEQHEKTIQHINDSNSSRMYESEKRANIYRIKAESGENGLRDLISHSAKLDRTLEEGRQLVKELTATIRLRDDQLRAVGKIITNDRNLLNE